MFISWPDLFWCVNDVYLRRFTRKVQLKHNFLQHCPGQCPHYTPAMIKRKAVLCTNVLICEYLHVKVRHNWVNLDSDLSHLADKSSRFKMLFTIQRIQNLSKWLNIPPLKVQDLWGSKKNQWALCVHVSRSLVSLSAFLPYWLRLQEALHQNLVQDRSLEANCGQSPVAVWHMVTICH